MITLRPVAPADSEAMLTVARSLPAWFNDQGLVEMARDFHSHQGILAVVENQVVGFVTWAPSPHTPEPGLIEITWLGVSPGWQGHGVGRRLVSALEEECRRHGVAVIQVSTLADSVDYPPYDGTRAFYRRLGFVDWRVDPGFYGAGADRLLLRRVL